MDKPSVGVCTICAKHSNAVEWHHTTPRAFGGSNSLEIPLCSDCHGLVHKKALAVYAFVTKGTKLKKQMFWSDIQSENRAQPYVETIVQAMLNHDRQEKTVKVMTALDAMLHTELMKLKTDLQLGSLDNAVRYCIQFTLEQKGFVNEKQKNKSGGNTNTSNDAGNRKRSEKTKLSLWDMHGINKRTSRE